MRDALLEVVLQLKATGRMIIIFVYRLLAAVFVARFACNGLDNASVDVGPNQMIKPYQGKVEQNIVSWDEHSIFVRGERIMLFIGEFHPFRLPVPDLWLDVFQKLRSAGFSAVSFYVDWVSGHAKLAVECWAESTRAGAA